MKMIRILLCILFLSFSGAEKLIAKVRVLTFQYNRADFVEFQAKAFKKFMLDDYEIIVFNDAPNPQHEKEIREMCEKYGIQCVRFEQNWHATDPLNALIRTWVDASFYRNSYFQFPLENGRVKLEAVAQQCSIRHCHVIQYALENFGYDHDDIVVVFDGDAFPIQAVSIRELTQDAPLIGVDSEFKTMHYFWVPFIAFDPRRLPDIRELKLHVGIIDDLICDTGSYSYQYIKDHPEVNYRLYPRRNDYDFFPWDSLTFLNFGFHPELAKITWPVGLEYYVDYHFMHFTGGSNPIHSWQKQQGLLDFLHTVLEE